MATTPVLVSVEEYLSTVYRPDCDYVDGEVLERNMGETPHARLQTFFSRFFGAHEDEWLIEVLPEQRLQINPRRYRIPDVMVTGLPEPEQRIVKTPPLLCIEILSSEDRLRKIQERLDDYAAMGVRSMWIIDPWRRVAYTAGPDGVRPRSNRPPHRRRNRNLHHCRGDLRRTRPPRTALCAAPLRKLEFEAGCPTSRT